jgi:broad specificity phosphatase PhoE
MTEVPGAVNDVGPTRVMLIRHGESNVTVRRIIGGHRTCTGLSDLGRRQATRLHDRLGAARELAATHLYTSGYPRAIETAELIAPALGLPVQIEAGFGEHDPGPECDGMAFTEFVERFGVPEWESDPHDVTFPGGETVAEFHQRVGSTLARTVRDNPGAAIVVSRWGDRCRLPLVARAAADGRFRAAHRQRLPDRVRSDAARSVAARSLQRRSAPRRAADRDTENLTCVRRTVAVMRDLRVRS